jgi:hypothetical protein
MLCRALSIAVVAGSIVSILLADDPVPANTPSGRASIEGLWQGFWGGGEADGVIRLPAMAELFIEGDRVEARGLPNIGSLIGRIRADDTIKTIRMTPKANAPDQPAPKPLDFTYQIKDDRLTLVDAEKRPISFARRSITRDALANTELEIVTANGIDDAGNLLVTEFTVLKRDEAEGFYFNPHDGKRPIKDVNVLLVQRDGLKKISVNQARAVIHDPMPVAITYRPHEPPLPPELGGGELFKDFGRAQPDSDAVLKTLSRVLRPGTLVFVLSAPRRIEP